jgi:hypothetical protein
MAGTVDIKVRAPQIRADVTISGETNFAEALARLFDDPTITDPAPASGTSTPLKLRLQNILDNSGDTFSDGISHFSGIFLGSKNSNGWGDTGFKPDFQDHGLWPGSSMQVGHFMTAVDMGYRPIKTYLYVKQRTDRLEDIFMDPEERRWVFLKPPPPDPDKPIRPGWWSPDELECVSLIIAHEQVADSGVYGAEPSFWCKVKTALYGASPQESEIFRQAFDSLAPQFEIGKARGKLSSITIGTGSGDSLQDLLLSLFGFKFGAMIRKSEITSIADGGNWVRLNLKDPTSKP